MAACHGRGSSTTVVKYFAVLSFFESKMCVTSAFWGLFFVFACLRFCLSIRLSVCLRVSECLCVCVWVCLCLFLCVCSYILQVCSGVLASRKCVCALLQVQGSWSTTGGWRGEKG